MSSDTIFTGTSPARRSRTVLRSALIAFGILAFLVVLTPLVKPTAFKFNSPQLVEAHISDSSYSSTPSVHGELRNVPDGYRRVGILVYAEDGFYYGWESSPWGIPITEPNQRIDFGEIPFAYGKTVLVVATDEGAKRLSNAPRTNDIDFETKVGYELPKGVRKVVAEPRQDMCIGS